MKRRNEVLVGILLTIATVIGVMGTIWLVRGGLSSGYPLYAVFNWGAGLRKGQPVLLAGVTVGYVADVELRDDGTLFVSMRVRDQYKVPEGTKATVKAVGVFGDQAIALTPLRPNRVKIEPGDTVPTGKPTPTTDEILARLDTVGRNVADVSQAFQVQLVREGGIADLRKTLASTNQLVGQLSAIAAEQSRQLSATMSQLRRTASAVDSASVDSTMRNLQVTSANMAALTSGLRETTSRLNLVLAKVDSGNGTAAKLLNDPGLYNDIRALVARVDSLTADFKKNPRRYINLEIF